MSIVQTIDTLVGPNFAYSKEYRAKALGMPLMEFHAVSAGNESIDVQSALQLINFLNEWGVKYSNIALGHAQLITLLGRNHRVVTFKFASVGPMVVQTSSFNHMKLYVRKILNEEKARLKEDYQNKVNEKDSIFNNIANLSRV